MISQTDKASRIFREAVVSAVPPERNIVKYVSDKLLPYCPENKMIVFFFHIQHFRFAKICRTNQSVKLVLFYDLDY